MGYRPHPGPGPMLFGYDPHSELPADHLARLVDASVEEALSGMRKPVGRGQPEYDPRVICKVLVYGYATGARSSRQLARLCREHLPYLYLTRGEKPSHMALSWFRAQRKDLLEKVWVALLGYAAEMGIKRLGHIVVNSTKLRANTGPEAVVKAREHEAMLKELERILAEAEETDRREEQEGYGGETTLGQEVDRERMRDIVRRMQERQSNRDTST